MEVELPNGVIAEFPDDMPHDQIQSVISSHLGSRQTQKEAESSAFDSIKKTKPGMPEFLIKALMLHIRQDIKLRMMEGERVQVLFYVRQ